MSVKRKMVEVVNFEIKIKGMKCFMYLLGWPSINECQGRYFKDEGCLIQKQFNIDLQFQNEMEPSILVCKYL